MAIFIKFDYMEPLTLKVTALAEQLGVSRKTLSTIINQRAGVTPDMALRLSLAFQTSPELWLNLQRSHDLWAAGRQIADGNRSGRWRWRRRGKASVHNSYGQYSQNPQN